MAEIQRLFFALWPDAGVRDQLAQIQRGMKDDPGRLNHPQDLHITLVFLGAVETQQLSCVKSVADAIRCPPFELTLDRLGYWRQPRIRWCAPAHKPRVLDRLVQDLKDGLQACHFQPETRPYAPHVTLQRKAAVIAEQGMNKPVAWSAREFVLAASQDKGVVPRYQVLKRWRLAES